METSGQGVGGSPKEKIKLIAWELVIIVLLLTSYDLYKVVGSSFWDWEKIK